MSSRRQRLFERLAAFRDQEELRNPGLARYIQDHHLAEQAALAAALGDRLAGDRIAPAVVLASPTGTGKTIIALAAALQNLDELDRFDRLVIIAPNAHVRDRWLERAGQMTADESLAIVAARRAPRKHEILGCTVGSLPAGRLPRRTLIILDEAHRGTQNETRATYERLKEACQDRAVILVSATPYQLSTSGLIAMLSVNASKERRDELAPIRQLADRLRPVVIRGTHGQPPTAEQIQELADTANRSRQVIDHHLIRPSTDAGNSALYRPDQASVHPVPLASSDMPNWALGYWVARATASLTDSRPSDTFNRMLDSSCEAFFATAVACALRQANGATSRLAAQLANELGAETSHPKVRATVDWIAERAGRPGPAARHVLVFTYFLATQEALAAALCDRLPDIQVEAPTTTELAKGLTQRFRMPPAQGTGPIVLVVTDRFSESVDLDGGQPCVVHHDLHWNPNRIRQRMGRVTRLSSGFQHLDPADVFIPVLDTPTDTRMYKTVLKRFALGDLLIPAEFEDDLEDIPHKLRDAVLGVPTSTDAPSPPRTRRG
jgi:superfamily II DNA or RNA helicase